MTGKQLKVFREKAGFTQVELARRIKMAPQNLSSIENGRLKPWPKVKCKLARVLKVTESELFPEVANDNH
jgi:transcriptional regulator with XRE-family HTH domain